MAIKELKLLGKTIYLHSVKYKAKSLENCDSQGNIVTSKRTGKTDTKYYVGDKEIPKSDVVKLLELPSGEKKPVRKLNATKEIQKVEKIEENVDEILRGHNAVELLYVVNTTDEEIRSDILEKGISYKFGYTNGNGFKVYKIYMTRYKGKIVMYGCLGNTEKAIENFNFDEEIQIEENSVANATEQEIMAIME